ncbi:MAG: hypothetical protein OET90_01945 [Desulfuromonadales bacterium]|nr:hypothetical protein [Desulfuromonadales bacterium]
MKTKALWVGLCLLLLTACGPMIGGMMVAGTGVKSFEVVSGDLSDLQPGQQVAVLGPFDKTDQAFYICRGEEAASFTSAFNLSKLFGAELAINERFPEELPSINQFRGQSPAQVQTALGLNKTPEILMSGTILSRDMVAAPAQGVIMTVSYRLEFLDLSNGETVTLEIEVKELFQDAVPTTVEELAGRLGE